MRNSVNYEDPRRMKNDVGKAYTKYYTGTTGENKYLNKPQQMQAQTGRYQNAAPPGNTLYYNNTFETVSSSDYVSDPKVKWAIEQGYLQPGSRRKADNSNIPKSGVPAPMPMYITSSSKIDINSSNLQMRTSSSYGVVPFVYLPKSTSKVAINTEKSIKKSEVVIASKMQQFEEENKAKLFREMIKNAKYKKMLEHIKNQANRNEKSRNVPHLTYAEPKSTPRKSDYSRRQNISNDQPRTYSAKHTAITAETIEILEEEVEEEEVVYEPEPLPIELTPRIPQNRQELVNDGAVEYVSEIRTLDIPQADFNFDPSPRVPKHLSNGMRPGESQHPQQFRNNPAVNYTRNQVNYRVRNPGNPFQQHVDNYLKNEQSKDTKNAISYPQYAGPKKIDEAHYRYSKDPTQTYIDDEMWLQQQCCEDTLTQKQRKHKIDASFRNENDSGSSDSNDYETAPKCSEHLVSTVQYSQEISKKPLSQLSPNTRAPFDNNSQVTSAPKSYTPRKPANLIIREQRESPHKDVFGTNTQKQVTTGKSSEDKFHKLDCESCKPYGTSSGHSCKSSSPSVTGRYDTSRRRSSNQSFRSSSRQQLQYDTNKKLSKDSFSKLASELHKPRDTSRARSKESSSRLTKQAIDSSSRLAYEIDNRNRPRSSGGSSKSEKEAHEVQNTSSRRSLDSSCKKAQDRFDKQSVQFDETLSGSLKESQEPFYGTKRSVNSSAKLDLNEDDDNRVGCSDNLESIIIQQVQRAISNKLSLRAVNELGESYDNSLSRSADNSTRLAQETYYGEKSSTIGNSSRLTAKSREFSKATSKYPEDESLTEPRDSCSINNKLSVETNKSTNKPSTPRAAYSKLKRGPPRPFDSSSRHSDDSSTTSGNLTFKQNKTESDRNSKKFERTTSKDKTPKIRTQNSLKETQNNPKERSEFTQITQVKPKNSILKRPSNKSNSDAPVVNTKPTVNSIINRIQQVQPRKSGVPEKRDSSREKKVVKDEPKKETEKLSPKSNPVTPTIPKQSKIPKAVTRPKTAPGALSRRTVSHETINEVPLKTETGVDTSDKDTSVRVESCGTSIDPVKSATKGTMIDSSTTTIQTITTIPTTTSTLTETISLSSLFKESSNTCVKTMACEKAKPEESSSVVPTIPEPAPLQPKNENRCDINFIMKKIKEFQSTLDKHKMGSSKTPSNVISKTLSISPKRSERSDQAVYPEQKLLFRVTASQRTMNTTKEESAVKKSTPNLRATKDMYNQIQFSSSDCKQFDAKQLLSREISQRVISLNKMKSVSAEISRQIIELDQHIETRRRSGSIQLSQSSLPAVSRKAVNLDEQQHISPEVSQKVIELEDQLQPETPLISRMSINKKRSVVQAIISEEEKTIQDSKANKFDENQPSKLDESFDSSDQKQLSLKENGQENIQVREQFQEDDQKSVKSVQRQSQSKDTINIDQESSPKQEIRCNSNHFQQSQLSDKIQSVILNTDQSLHNIEKEEPILKELDKEVATLSQKCLIPHHVDQIQSSVQESDNESINLDQILLKLPETTQISNNVNQEQSLLQKISQKVLELKQNLSGIQQPPVDLDQQQELLSKISQKFADLNQHQDLLSKISQRICNINQHQSILSNSKKDFDHPELSLNEVQRRLIDLTQRGSALSQISQRIIQDEQRQARFIQISQKSITVDEKGPANADVPKKNIQNQLGVPLTANVEPSQVEPLEKKTEGLQEQQNLLDIKGGSKEVIQVHKRQSTKPKSGKKTKKSKRPKNEDKTEENSFKPSASKTSRSPSKKFVETRYEKAGIGSSSSCSENDLHRKAVHKSRASSPIVREQKSRVRSQTTDQQPKYDKPKSSKTEELLKQKFFRPKSTPAFAEDSTDHKEHVHKHRRDNETATTSVKNDHKDKHKAKLKKRGRSAGKQVRAQPESLVQTFYRYCIAVLVFFKNYPCKYLLKYLLFL